MDHYNWTVIPVEEMSALLTRQVIHTEHLTIARLRLRKGALVPLHHHVNEQVTMLDAGTLRFELEGREVLVKAGEALRIPPNAPHRVEALEDSVCTDLFSPPRADWISGDDAYLRK
ncbi:MAG: cupin domain-containing protein [Acidobacteriota bacterium]